MVLFFALIRSFSSINAAVIFDAIPNFFLDFFLVVYFFAEIFGELRDITKINYLERLGLTQFHSGGRGSYSLPRPLFVFLKPEKSKVKTFTSYTLSLITVCHDLLLK